MHHLYSVTAVADGRAVVGFCIAANPRKAIAKATSPGIRVTHATAVCRANHSRLHRDGLLKLLPPKDQLRSVVSTINRSKRGIRRCIAELIAAFSPRWWRYIIQLPDGSEICCVKQTPHISEVIEEAEEAAAEWDFAFVSQLYEMRSQYDNRPKEKE